MAKNKDGFEGGKLLTLEEQRELKAKQREKQSKSEKASKAEDSKS